MPSRPPAVEHMTDAAVGREGAPLQHWAQLLLAGS